MPEQPIVLVWERKKLGVIEYLSAEVGNISFDIWRSRPGRSPEVTMDVMTLGGATLATWSYPGMHNSNRARKDAEAWINSLTETGLRRLGVNL